MQCMVLFVLFGAALSGSVDFHRNPGSVHLTYDCRTATHLFYNHPTDCTRYIHCDKGEAWDKPCPLCDLNNTVMCTGETYLHFQSSIHTTGCIWPANSTCITPTPTTETTITTTEGSGNTCERDCSENGDCKSFRVCVGPWTFHKTDEKWYGVWETRQCGAQGTTELFWNPDIHTRRGGSGGTCDRWENLSAFIREKYSSDPDCIPECYWKESESETDRCEGKYNYWNGIKGNAPETLTCPSPLLFNIDTLTCDFCSNLKSTTCC